MSNLSAVVQPRPLSVVEPPNETTPPHNAAATTSMRVVAIEDALVERFGHDPRSRYVETFWLSTLGPSTLLLLRHLCDGLTASPEGFALDRATCAFQLGLGDRDGKNGPFQRAFSRLEQFGLAATKGDNFAVRRAIPSLPQRFVLRLPAALRSAHDRWSVNQSEVGVSVLEELRRRARIIAMALTEIGDSQLAIGDQLVGWGFHPSIAFEATQHAMQATAAPGIGASAS